MQCQWCKTPHSSEMLLPLLYPSAEWNWTEECVRFCYNCMTNQDDQYPLLPGPWLHNEWDMRDPANHTEHYTNMARWKDHKLTNWMVAVPAGDYLADSALLLHQWDEASFTWLRLPLGRIIPAQTPETWPFTNFLDLCQGVRAAHMKVASAGAFTRARLQGYKDVLNFVEEQYPDLTDQERRHKAMYHAKQIARAADRSMIHIGPTRRRAILECFQRWEQYHMEKAATNQSTTLQQYLSSATCGEHLLDFWHEVLPCLDQHFICCNRDCTHVIESAHWLRDIQDHNPKQGQYRCPKCLTLYRPSAEYKYKAGPEAKPFVPASQCLVVRYTPETPLAPDSWAQKLATYDNSNDQFYLYLCEFPEQKESVLLNDLKKACQQLAKDIDGTSDPLQALHHRIKTELDKAQKVPYFKKFTWDPHHITTVEAWTALALGALTNYLEKPMMNRRSLKDVRTSMRRPIPRSCPQRIWWWSWASAFAEFTFTMKLALSSLVQPSGTMFPIPRPGVPECWVTWRILTVFTFCDRWFPYIWTRIPITHLYSGHAYFDIYTSQQDSTSRVAPRFNTTRSDPWSTWIDRWIHRCFTYHILLINIRNILSPSSPFHSSLQCRLRQWLSGSPITNWLIWPLLWPC